MLRRKAQQSGSGAAVLVGIITLMIILYVLFVPPSEREKMLDVNLSEGGVEEPGEIVHGVEHNKTLLAIHPGKIFYLPLKTIEHELPGVNLYTKTEGVVIKEIDSLAVKSALFTDKKFNLSFILDDPENTKSVLLSFNVLKYTSGELIIRLNGNEILNKEIKGIVEPVKLPKEFLSFENVLEFEASGVGVVFWKVNEFILDNIKITADITELAAGESKSIFLVSRSEKENLDKASLKFFAGFKRDEVGRLFVEINGYEIFTGIPDYGQIRAYQFSPEKLVRGENVVRFRTEKGHYLLDRIMVKTELTEPEEYIWFFDLNYDESDAASKNQIKINLSIEFADDSYKDGFVVINGHQTGFSSRKLKEEWVINPYVRRGGNTIKLDPKNNMFITDLRVFIE